MIAEHAEHRILTRYATPNNYYQLLQYALQNNIGEMRQALSAPEDRRLPASLILDEYVEVEHSIVESWNLSRLGGVAPRDADADVPDMLYNFVLRGAANDLSKDEGFYFRLPKYVLRFRPGHAQHLQAQSALLSHPDSHPQLQTVEDAMHADEDDLNVRMASLALPVVAPHEPAKPSNASEKNNSANLRVRPLNVPFPNGVANITIAEVLAFLPGWTTSRHMINRILSNGGSPGLVAKIMMAHQTNPTNYNAARTTMSKKFSRHMKVLHGDDWTPTEHQIPEGHDENSIDVGNFKTQAELEGFVKFGYKPISSVAFKDLANGAKYATGAEALDLTRCIQYHVDHPDERWIFPEDYHKLLGHIGGPLPVTPDHLDRSVFLHYGASMNYPQMDLPQTASPSLDLLSDGDNSVQENPPSIKAIRRFKKMGHKATKTQNAKKDDIAEESSDEEEAFRASRYADSQGRKNARNGTIRRSGRTRNTIYNSLSEKTIIEDQIDEDVNNAGPSMIEDITAVDDIAQGSHQTEMDVEDEMDIHEATALPHNGTYSNDHSFVGQPSVENIHSHNESDLAVVPSSANGVETLGDEMVEDASNISGYESDSDLSSVDESVIAQFDEQSDDVEVEDIASIHELASDGDKEVSSVSSVDGEDNDSTEDFSDGGHDSVIKKAPPKKRGRNVSNVPGATKKRTARVVGSDQNDDENVPEPVAKKQRQNLPISLQGATVRRSGRIYKRNEDSNMDQPKPAQPSAKKQRRNTRAKMAPEPARLRRSLRNIKR